MFFLNFSDRRTGNCGSIAAFCAQMQGGRAVDIPEIFARGCGACQTECFQKDGVCPLPDAPAITALYEAITEQGACFIVPNYCDWPCSNFFRFCERGCGYFGTGTERAERYLAAEKHFIVVSNTNRAHFEEIFSEHVPSANSPHILFLSAAAYHRVSLRGDLVEVEEVRAALRAFFDEPPVKL
ncbi:MAG: hypothetical protein V8T48_02455 [Oscillospiraceae bacterium]|jgi:hypothetical protein